MNENEVMENNEVMADENYEIVEADTNETGKAVAIGAATAVVVTATIAGAAKGVRWLKAKWHDHKVKKAAEMATLQAEAIKDAAEVEHEEEFVETEN